jgi:hypothetical protein
MRTLRSHHPPHHERSACRRSARVLPKQQRPLLTFPLLPNELSSLPQRLSALVALAIIERRAGL